MIHNGHMRISPRSIQKSVLEDLEKKIILLIGPRQVGKTTFSKNLMTSYDYLNFDSAKDKLKIVKQQWDRNKKLIIFDEVHKMRHWKKWIKGVYDTEGLHPQIIVTGSARLDTVRKMGDSLAGRHFTYHLLPLDLKELHNTYLDIEKNFHQLLQYSGFPEPFFENSKRFHLNWQKSHMDLILRQDLISYENIRDITSIEILVEMLKERIASPLSYSSIAVDLQRDTKTIQKWMQYLENLFVIFKIKPYSKNIARSVLKEPKYYFYDYTRIENNEGAILENFVAVSLQKEIFYLNEIHGIDSELYYLKKKGTKELDFFIRRKGLPPVMIEVKTSENDISSAFKMFEKHFENPIKIQLVKNLKKEYSNRNSVHVLNLARYLTHFDLSKEKTI